MIADFLGALTQVQREKLRAWTGWGYMPEEMPAAMLAAWKSSYPVLVPYFSYCHYYPHYTKTPWEYYIRFSDYQIALEEEGESV